jgi:hypothetical protein
MSWTGFVCLGRGKSDGLFNEISESMKGEEVLEEVLD